MYTHNPLEECLTAMYLYSTVDFHITSPSHSAII